jgi:hypothetical protein
MAIQRQHGTPLGIAQALGNLGTIALCQRDVEAARPLFEEGHALFSGLGDRRGRAWALHGLAVVARWSDELLGGRALEEQSLALRRDLGNRQGMAECLAGMAELAHAQGQPERAARLLGAADAICEALGHALVRHAKQSYERGVAAARTTLGEEAFARAWAEGRALSLEQAIIFALEEGGSTLDERG